MFTHQGAVAGTHTPGSSSRHTHTHQGAVAGTSNDYLLAAACPTICRQHQLLLHSTG